MGDWIEPGIGLVLLVLITIQALSGYGSRPGLGGEDRKNAQQSRDRDYTAEAQALFRRFAERHELTYEVAEGVPIEVCWTFPEQPKLSLPLILGLQNRDELNFGVGDFWSYFFPFERVAAGFEEVLDAWVAGTARVAVMHGRGRLLQIQDGDTWRAVYGANGCLFPFRRWPRGFLQNQARIEAGPGASAPARSPLP